MIATILESHTETFKSITAGEEAVALAVKLSNENGVKTTAQELDFILKTEEDLKRKGLPHDVAKSHLTDEEWLIFSLVRVGCVQNARN